MNPVQIREVPAADYPTVARHVHALDCAEHSGAPAAFDLAKTVEILRKIAADSPCCILGAYDQQHGLVATLIIGGYEWHEVRGGRLLIVTALFVDEHHRSRQIGAALYRAAREVAISRGAAGLELHVRRTNIRGRRFYRNLQLRPTGLLLYREWFGPPRTSAAIIEGHLSRPPESV